MAGNSSYHVRLGGQGSLITQIPQCLAQPRVSLIWVLQVTAVSSWLIQSEWQPFYQGAGHSRSTLRSGSEACPFGMKTTLPFPLGEAPLQDGQLILFRPSDTKVSLLSLPLQQQDFFFTSRKFLNSHSLMGEKESVCLNKRNCSQRWHGGFLSPLSLFFFSEKKNKHF